MTTEEPPQEEQGPLPRTREAVDWWLAKWGRAEPLTREDVERLIEVNGGTAEGLDLNGRDLHGADLEDAELQGADLSFADLEFANLNFANLQRAHLSDANLRSTGLIGAKLQGADLSFAKLQRARVEAAYLEGTYLEGAQLQRADLRTAGLDSADFEGASQGEWANMGGVRLYGATITDATRLRHVLWGKSMTLGDELDKEWGEAIEPYRDLKQWHQRTGDYDTADRFHYREWECKRKLAQQEKRPWEIAELWMYRLLSGYGGRPWRVVLSGAVAVLLFTLLYMLPWVAVDPSLAGLGATLQRFGKALYFSGVSFTALGYGGWLENDGIVPVGWTKYLWVVESLLGISLIALFLVTFTRKLVR